MSFLSDKRKRILLALLIIAVIVLLVFGMKKAERILVQRADDEILSAEAGSTWRTGTITYDGKNYAPRLNMATLLFIGVDDQKISDDTDPYRNPSQADFLLLAVLDREKNTCHLIQIDRDTVTEVPILGRQGTVTGYATEQIALAHTYGDAHEQSCENTVDAVERLFMGISIDHYVSFVMGGIAELNDYVGGIPVLVEDDFTGVENAFTQGETVTLQGEQAETFVRARSDMPDDPTNIARMRRQKQYFSKLMEVLQKKAGEDGQFLTRMYTDLSDYILTNCSANEMLMYNNSFSRANIEEITNISGQSVRGEKYMEFLPDTAVLRRQIIDLFYDPIA